MLQPGRSHENTVRRIKNAFFMPDNCGKNIDTLTVSNTVSPQQQWSREVAPNFRCTYTVCLVSNVLTDASKAKSFLNDVFVTLRWLVFIKTNYNCFYFFHLQDF
jgi:hypothetical protein